MGITKHPVGPAGHEVYQLAPSHLTIEHKMMTACGTRIRPRFILLGRPLPSLLASKAYLETRVVPRKMSASVPTHGATSAMFVASWNPTYMFMPHTSCAATSESLPRRGRCRLAKILAAATGCARLEMQEPGKRLQIPGHTRHP